MENGASPMTADYPKGEFQFQNEGGSSKNSDLLFEEHGRFWDLNDESAVDDDDIIDENTVFTKATKLLKVLVYLITFCIVLICGVISKGTFFFMTSVIGKDKKFSPCNINDLGRDDKYVIKISIQERYGWTWCVLFALFIPEILTFFRCCRLCIFKQYQKPKISSFLVVLMIESAYVIGLITLIFVVFPHMNAVKALGLTNAVCIVPSFLNVFSSWNSQNSTKAWTKNVLNLAAFTGQASIFVWAPLNSNSTGVGVAAIAGVLLVSCSWWENFVGTNFPKCIIRTKDDIEKSRSFIYLFISIWKIAFILILSLFCLFWTDSYENVKSFLTEIPDSFKKHNVTVLWPEVPNIPTTLRPPITPIQNQTYVYLKVIILAIHVAASFLCYSCGKFVSKICIQGFSYALPVCLTVPLAVSLLTFACHKRLNAECVFVKVTYPYLFWNCPQERATAFFEDKHGIFWIIWLISQVWITRHMWYPHCERMASTNKLFVNPMYSTVFIDQSLALNRRKDEKAENRHEIVQESLEDVDSFPRIFACATMWHETPDEMELLLKSIMRMDVHQCSQKTIQDGLVMRNPDYYEMEAHIFFDDAFVISDEDDEKMTINKFVKDLIVAVDAAASKVYKKCAKIDPPIKVPTPYGGRLIWRLLGDNALVVHIKNKELIRHKKRWSQVMYMYYLLGYRLESSKMYGHSTESLLKNTFILALDGDIDFKPNAVQLLVDLMNRNKSLGAACGRIHPVGTGLMVYYQKFEYAIGHWLQKATEHTIGCVLCSPGCFSLFRAEALVKKNTIRRYATLSKEAIEYVQFDQGEDRWLCTLLLQRGYRVEYSAASDAYTHCPESFAEFYTQRRRWAPSTMANIMDLLINYRKTVECNDNISRPYIGYQVLLMIGTILGPGTIFLMLVGAMVSAFGISNWQSFIANMVPIVFFILICFHAKNDTQIFIAEIFSALYALLMMAVLVGISLQLVVDGITSPSAIFILAMTASFVIAALAHPQEFWCVAHGLIYFLSVPSMYLLLALYSFVNLHVVSWGTREVQTKKSKKQLEAERLRAVATVQRPKNKSGMFDWMNMFNDAGSHPSEEEGSISFGFANLFRCLCCTYPKPDPSSLHVVKIEAHLKDINNQMYNLQKQLDTSTNRSAGFRRRSSIHILKKDNVLNPLPEDEDTEEEEEIFEELQTDGFEEHMYNQPDNHEYWLSDPSLEKSSVKRLLDDEKTFWTELIDTYLYPLIEDPDDKAKVSRQLIELRNKVVFGILMLNSLFILIVFLLQMQKETLHVEWPLSVKANITYLARIQEIRIEMEYLQLEPINLVLVFFFTLILVIQFIAMLFHRLETLSHILASTNLIDSKTENTEEINFSELANILQRQGLRDDDEMPLIDVDEGDRSGDVLFKESVNGRLPNAMDGGSLAGDRLRDRPKFRSLSIALEQDLHKILQRDPKFALKVRRMSRNPDVLNVLRRRTSCYNQGTPGVSRTPTPQGTMRSAIARLDSAFGTPASSTRHSFYNRAFDTVSVDSIQMIELSSNQVANSQNSRSLDRTSLRNSSLKQKLNRIKEDRNKMDDAAV